MGIGNLITNLYKQIGPGLPSEQYECKGYAKDSENLGVVNNLIEREEEAWRDRYSDSGTFPSIDNNELWRSLTGYRDQIQNCLSDVGNVLTGSSGNEPNLGLYIGVAAAVAGGIGGLAMYMRSKNNKSKNSDK